tara:strand:- start:200 stop:1000 length:801 start_codon:yes stop_codon:yes gene_type:complete
MNRWIKRSLYVANNPNYLDNLYRVYPIQQSGTRPLNAGLWTQIEREYNAGNWEMVIELLIDSRNDIFPIKDGYVGFWRQDKSTISSNPGQVQRIATILSSMTFEGMKKACSRPKESNQTIGPMFRNWYKQASNSLGIPVMDLATFQATSRDAILDGSDDVLKQYATDNLGYSINKGLDFIARVNGKYVIGEAKWITTPGGNQDKSFQDAKAMVEDSNLHSNVIPIMILDGVLYLASRGKLYVNLTENYKEYNIMSALVLKEFLASL